MLNSKYMYSLRQPYRIVLRSTFVKDGSEFFFSTFFAAQCVFNEIIDSDLEYGLFWSVTLFKGKKILKSYSNYINAKI